MLTGYQVEVVAFITDCEIICPDCARAEYGETRIAATELGRGYGDVSPLIRYQIDELNGERVYEAAREVADERGIDPDDWQALDDIVEGLGEAYEEHCGNCGEHLG